MASSQLARAYSLTTQLMKMWTKIVGVGRRVAATPEVDPRCDKKRVRKSAWQQETEENVRKRSEN